MNQWKYKIIGFLLGMLTRRPQFIVLGLIVGHLFDIGFFSNQGKPSQTAGSDTKSPSACQVLGVAENADWDVIEQAYRKKISDYHPDKVASAAPELKALAEQRAREINAAYDELQKSRKP